MCAAVPSSDSRGTPLVATTPATSAIAASDMARGKNAVGFRASVQILAATSMQNLGPETAVTILSFRPSRQEVYMVRRTRRWRAPRPKVLPLPTSEHTELCYAFEGRAYTFCRLRGERVEGSARSFSRSTRSGTRVRPAAVR